MTKTEEVSQWQIFKAPIGGVQDAQPVCVRWTLDEALTWLISHGVSFSTALRVWQSYDDGTACDRTMLKRFELVALRQPAQGGEMTRVEQ